MLKKTLKQKSKIIAHILQKLHSATNTTMKTTHEPFLNELQQTARRQSRLQNNSVFPKFMNPVNAFIGEKPWQTLVLSSFIFSWIVFLFWFEFFYNFVHNIV